MGTRVTQKNVVTSRSILHELVCVQCILLDSKLISDIHDKHPNVFKEGHLI